MDELLHLVHRGGASPLLAVPNVTVHPSTASVRYTVSLYDGPLHCGFNVSIKGLMLRRSLTAIDLSYLVLALGLGRVTK